ncbi:MAG: hypothetical protein ACRCW2_10690, partial [Cellulosilyticaceae bacterium]
MYLQMEVDKAFATVGEELLYTIHIGNDEEDEIRDLCLIDELGDGLKIVGDSIKVAERYIIGDLKKGIQIGTIPIGESRTIAFKLIIEKIPEFHSITHIVDIEYILSHQTEYRRQQSNTAITIISDPCISAESGGIFLSSSKKVVDLGECITYTLMLKNKGNVAAKNLVIQGVPDGAHIPVLDVNQEYVLTYDVCYDRIPDDFVEAKRVNVSYEFMLANRQIIYHSCDSNTCQVVMQTATFDQVIGGSSKKVSLQQCTLGEEITYTLELVNKGNQVAQKMWYQEPIPVGTTWVTDSLKVDGLLRRGECVSDGISILDLSSGQSTVIEYKLKVKEFIPYPNPIGEIGVLSYSYQVDQQEVDRTYHIDQVTTEVHAAILEVGETTGCKIEIATNKMTLSQQVEGQILLYNSGNKDAEKISISIDIPPYMKWEAEGWVVEEGTAYVYYQERLAAQSVYQIPFTMTVNVLPKEQQINLYPHITYSYTVGYRSIPKALMISLDQPISVQSAIISQSDDGLVKQVDKKIAQVGDVLSYTLWLTNTGNIPAENIVVKEVLPPELQLITSEENIQAGISIGQLREGEQKVVRYQARVRAMKPSTHIQPDTHIAYGFPLGSEYIEQWIETNQAQTTLEMADLQGEIVVSKGVATLEDLLTYTLTLQNEGNMPAYDIEEILPIIPGCRWLSQGMSINQLDVGEKVQRTYTLQVERIPVDDQIDAYVQIRYAFKTTQGEEVRRHYTTGHISTPVIAPQIKQIDEGLQKHVSQQSAVKGEILTYTLMLKNTGNVTAKEVTIKEELSTGIRLIPGTVNIGGKLNEQEALTMPFVVEELGPGATMHISYKVKVIDLPDDEIVVSRSRVAYQYVVPYEEEVMKQITEEISSLPTKIEDTKISTRHGTLTQQVDVSEADVGDYLHYTIKLVNAGNTEAITPYYQVSLSEGLSYVPKSLKLGGEMIGDRLERIQLPNIAVEKVYEITFTAKIITLPTEKTGRVEGRLSYKLCRNGVEITNITEVNEVAQTQIHTAGPIKQEDFWQETSQDVAHLGDKIQCTYKIRNMGNRIMKNTILRLKEDLIHLSMTKESGEYLGDIKPLETREVTLEMNVIDIPSQSYLGPIGQLDYAYVVGSGEPRQATKLSNEVTLKIQDTGLQKKGQVKLEVDRAYAQIGEWVTYDVYISNSGNTSALNVTAKIKIDQEVEILPESIAIFPKEKAVGKVGTIHIEKIMPEEEVRISFKAKVMSIPEAEKVTTQVSVSYGYKDACQKLQMSSVATNEVTTTIRSIDFSGECFSKEILQEECTVGEVISYTIKCLNKGNIVAKDVKIIQRCPEGIRIVNDTVKLENGTRLRCRQGEEILIGDMRPNEQAIIQFEAKVEKLADVKEWVDESKILYEGELVPQQCIAQESYTLKNNIRVKAPQLDIQMQMEEAEVLLGDTIGVKVRITNIGNQGATHVILEKILPSALVLVPYSISIDGLGGQSIESLGELNIPQIEREQTVTLYMRAKVMAQIGKDTPEIRPRITYHFELRNNKYEMIAEGPPIILTVHQPALDIMIQSDQDDTKV